MKLPDIAEYRERFTAVEQAPPEVMVILPELSVFDELLVAEVAVAA